MVAYWGQNGVYGIHKERNRWEKELDYFCKSYSYDVVVLAFNHVFFDSRNKGRPCLCHYIIHVSMILALYGFLFLLRKNYKLVSMIAADKFLDIQTAFTKYFS